MKLPRSVRLTVQLRLVQLRPAGACLLVSSLRSAIRLDPGEASWEATRSQPDGWYIGNAAAKP